MPWRYLLSLTLLTGIGLSGADHSSWDNLRGLHAGDRIVVIQKGFKDSSGKFTQVSDEAITLQSGGKDLAIQRADVLRVSRLGHSHRVRNAVIGAAILGGIATAVAVPFGIYLNNETGNGATAYAAIPAAAGVGAALGALAPSNETIYRAPKR